MSLWHLEHTVAKSPRMSQSVSLHRLDLYSTVFVSGLILSLRRETFTAVTPYLHSFTQPLRLPPSFPLLSYSHSVPATATLPSSPQRNEGRPSTSPSAPLRIDDIFTLVPGEGKTPAALECYTHINTITHKYAFSHQHRN